MNNRGYVIIGLILALGVGSALGLSQTKWNLGYEKAIRVENVEPLKHELYYSITGVEDKVWWEMSSVQDRAEYLLKQCQNDPYCVKELLEPVQSIACSADGRYLYIGVDK